MTEAIHPRTTAVASDPHRTAVFRATVRSEWTKLGTVRSTYWTLAFTVVAILGLGILFTALEVGRWDQRTPQEIAEFNPLIYSLAGMNLAQISIGVLGVLMMTSEYSTGTITSTLAATPQRSLLLTAKVTAFAVVVVVVSIVSTMAAFLIGQVILGPDHGGLSITDPGVLRGVLGGATFLLFIGVIGLGVGAAVRRTTGAVAILFAVLLVIPGLVLLLPSPWDERVGQILPSAAGEAMAAPQQIPQLLSPTIGVLVLAAWALVAFGAGGLALARRDV
ncbi:MAG: transporter permease [Ilumatobacteraceae bacterium]|nr:transporter permease [Ilumatobacteraceae bacterium]